MHLLVMWRSAVVQMHQRDLLFRFCESTCRQNGILWARHYVTAAVIEPNDYSNSKNSWPIWKHTFSVIMSGRHSKTHTFIYRDIQKLMARVETYPLNDPVWPTQKNSPIYPQRNLEQ